MTLIHSMAGMTTFLHRMSHMRSHDGRIAMTLVGLKFPGQASCATLQVSVDLVSQPIWRSLRPHWITFVEQSS